jgi:predicted nucleic acid-binding protein
MVIALDTNILVSLWNAENALNAWATELLEGLGRSADFVISAPVYCELLGVPNTSRTLDDLLDDTAISVDWNVSEAAWRSAAAAFQSYAKRRVASGSSAPRRLLTDFIIGAHALTNGYSLLTLDQRHYRAAFPRLKLQKI